MESTFRQGIIYSLTAYLLWGILPIYWKTLGVVQAFEILSNPPFFDNVKSAEKKQLL